MLTAERTVIRRDAGARVRRRAARFDDEQTVIVARHEQVIAGHARSRDRSARAERRRRLRCGRRDDLVVFCFQRPVVIAHAAEATEWFARWNREGDESIAQFLDARIEILLDRVALQVFRVEDETGMRGALRARTRRIARRLRLHEVCYFCWWHHPRPIACSCGALSVLRQRYHGEHRSRVLCASERERWVPC